MCVPIISVLQFFSIFYLFQEFFLFHAMLSSHSDGRNLLFISFTLIFDSTTLNNLPVSVTIPWRICFYFSVVLLELRDGNIPRSSFITHDYPIFLVFVCFCLFSFSHFQQEGKFFLSNSVENCVGNFMVIVLIALGIGNSAPNVVFVTPSMGILFPILKRSEVSYS